MSALPAATLDRLAKILGRLGSDHAGERSAAGVAASRLMREHGLTWPEVLMPRPPAGAACEPRAAWSPAPASSWRAQRAFALERPELLTVWELNFLLSLGRFGRLSPKQRVVLDRLVARAESFR